MKKIWKCACALSAMMALTAPIFAGAALADRAPDARDLFAAGPDGQVVVLGRQAGAVAERSEVEARPFAFGSGDYFFAGGEIVSSPKPVRLDGDPRSGIVFGNSLGEVYLLTADGVEAPGWPVSSDSAVGYSSAAVADIDGDGSEDIVIHANNALEVYGQDGLPRPGWPQTLDGFVAGNSLVGSPVVFDIDDDEDLEILVGHFTNMYAFHHDGTAVIGWPISQLHPFGPYFTTPAVGDLDDDGDAEICFKIYGGNGDPADVLLFHHDGIAVDGWPKLALERSNLSSPVFADIDDDGALDIFVSIHHFDAGNRVRAHAWSLDGAYLPGFPTTGSFNTTPNGNAVGDVDEDGFLELFVGNTNATAPFYAVHAWNHDGTTLAGAWPNPAAFCASNGSPALADVDGGAHEVFAGVGGCYVDDAGSMNVWATDGSDLAGFPQAVSGYLRSSPLVIDSDGDGVAEIYIGSSDGWIHRFDGGDEGDPAEWNQIFHDRRNTNRYPLVVPLDLAVSGSCPGAVTVTVEEIKPHGELVLLGGTTEGPNTVPQGSCEGTAIDLEDPRVVATLRANDTGIISATRTVGDGVCGRLLQALDLSRCSVSEVVTID